MQANTEHQLFARLRPVCRHQETAFLFRKVGRAMLWGLAVAGLAALSWAGATTCAWAGLPPVPRSVPVVVAIAALAVAPLAGSWLALRRKRDWHAAAVAVDRHYRLHDRTVTALEFIEKSERKPLEERQIVQCMEHLEGIDTRVVARPAVAGFVLIAVFFVLLGAAAVAFPLTAGPIASPSIEPQPKPSAPIAPVNEKAAPGRAADASLAEAVDWQVAPSGEVRVSRAALAAGRTLEEIVFGPDSAAAPRQTDAEARRPGPGPPRMALEGEPIPLEHRRTVRRYFESTLPILPSADTKDQSP